MKRRLWSSVALTAAAAALTASCALATAMYMTSISADELTGRWVVSDTAVSLTFREDHTFVTEDFGRYLEAEDCGPSGLPSGRWAFDDPSMGSGDEAVTHGSVLTLSSPDCTVSVFLFGEEDDPAMCPTFDPDAGCPRTGYLRRDRT
ncbi:hypothetical protein ACIOD1_04740 [Streptomyces sp. NPDC088097]|uniref:hypothetical protein n=1 Tax=Streptomyces sp. NPDC088097 TaxID=3365823 RepID=UPI003821E34A